MTNSKFVTALQALISEQQQVQMTNPPSTQPWQNASHELARLGKLLNEALFRERLQQFTDAAYELSVAWEALCDGTSAGYPFDKSFDDVLLDIIAWNTQQQQEAK